MTHEYVGIEYEPADQGQDGPEKLQPIAAQADTSDLGRRRKYKVALELDPGLRQRE